jgi:hypothetical protein
MVHAKELAESLTREARAFDDEAKKQGKAMDRAMDKKSRHKSTARHYEKKKMRDQAQKETDKAKSADAEAKEASAKKEAAKRRAAAKRASAKGARDNYIAFKFIMIITVAHEVVHFFTRYINGGNSGAATPPEVASKFFDHESDRGEAGGYWETLLLGGAIAFYENTDDPLGVRQAGVPYLLRDDNSCNRVRQSYMEEIVNGGKPETPTHLSPLGSL